MSRIDCSQTLNYVAELRRMCDSFTNCKDCPMALRYYRCTLIRDITQNRIDIVQKWSDEHPQETMVDHFYKLFPNALRSRKGKYPVFCPHHLGWGEDGKCQKYDGKYEDCEECWNRPYVEVKNND